MGFPGGVSGKESVCNAGNIKRSTFDPWIRKILQEAMATHSSILGWKIPWTEKLGGLHSPQGRKESNMTEVI